MNLNWKKLGITAAVVIGSAILIKVFPFWETTLPTLIGIGVGFCAGYYWSTKS